MPTLLHNVTGILHSIEEGDTLAAEQLLPVVYDELRKLAAAKLRREKPGQTLQPTALVHEAYLRLVEGGKGQHWNSRGHFFAAAAEAMRRILINRARARKRLKRGGAWKRMDLHKLIVAEQANDDEVLAVDEALQQLAQTHPPCAELVKLRFYAGLTLEEAANALGVTRRTADRYWAFARAWLYDALRSESSPCHR
jgi:RNA polymerase sigma factor (TIGR02999 family)